MDDSSLRAPDPKRNPDAPLLAPARRAIHAVIPRDTRFKAYFRLLDTPVLSELYVRSRGRLRNRRVRPATRLVLEGFPSSGNSYCLQAVLLANPDLSPDDVNSHTHSPRVVERAVKSSVPCIVIARDARDAVSSMVQRFVGVRLDSAFDYYTHYYQRLMPIRDSFVVAPFEAVTADCSAVVERCNQQFGSDLVTPKAAGITSERVWQEIEGRQRRRHGALKEQMISRPTASRKSAAEVLSDLTPAEDRAMRRAIETHRAFIQGSPLR